MNDDRRPVNPFNPSGVPDDPLPSVGARVRVIHCGRECIAYLDSEGNWRNEHNGDILRGTVTVIKVP